MWIQSGDVCECLVVWNQCKWMFSIESVTGDQISRVDPKLGSDVKYVNNVVKGISEYSHRAFEE